MFIAFLLPKQKVIIVFWNEINYHIKMYELFDDHYLQQVLKYLIGPGGLCAPPVVVLTTISGHC